MALVWLVSPPTQSTRTRHLLPRRHFITCPGELLTSNPSELHTSVELLTSHPGELLTSNPGELDPSSPLRCPHLQPRQARSVLTSLMSSPPTPTSWIPPRRAPHFPPRQAPHLLAALATFCVGSCGALATPAWVWCPGNSCAGSGVSARTLPCRLLHSLRWWCPRAPLPAPAQPPVAVPASSPGVREVRVVRAVPANGEAHDEQHSADAGGGDGAHQLLNTIPQ